MTQAHPTGITRRRLLCGMAAGGALAGRGAALAQTAPRVGLQLFTVRDRMMADVAGTLGRVAEIGYRAVEFAGYFGIAPGDIRRAVAEAGLSAPAAHLPGSAGPEALTANPERRVGEAAEAGHDWLVAPWLDPRERRTLDQYRMLADALNVFGDHCRAGGLRFAWHNHDFEFATLEGEVPFDLLMRRCDPDLVAFELDIYWAIHAGRDPRDLLAQYPGRFPLCHMKDRAPDGRMADVGAGTIDFAEIFADSDAGFVHAFVERDDAPDTLASAVASFAPARDAIAGR